MQTITLLNPKTGAEISFDVPSDIKDPVKAFEYSLKQADGGSTLHLSIFRLAIQLDLSAIKFNSLTR